MTALVATSLGKSRGIRSRESLAFAPTPRLKDSDTFLEISYSELEERNLKLKREREQGKTSDEFGAELRNIIADDDGIKALTVCFSVLEGKLHMLDYNKKYVLES